ncbi:MAG: LytTR family DNA-binding domain-containing protein [Candidatus Azobacteroides sp.]|nr:LytTR family DNA-binding domain-containing protein [Candidatus Azobacteroides sp.]
MNCIIIDDEPLARRAIELLVGENSLLKLSGVFNSASAASAFMDQNQVDLIFLDIQMPKVNGLEFARTISPDTLIIFTTAYTEYAVESYELDAVDYLVKPVEPARFHRAVSKAIAYHELLLKQKIAQIEVMEEDYLFVKSDRRYYKVEYKNILFIEGLKDYAIIQLENSRIITRTSLKSICEDLPKDWFYRISKSNIVNGKRIHSFDNNGVYIQQYEITIGNSYRDSFLNSFFKRKNK